MKLVATFLVRDSNMTIENSTQRIETFVNDAYGIEHQLANVSIYTKGLCIQSRTTQSNVHGYYIGLVIVYFHSVDCFPDLYSYMHVFVNISFNGVILFFLSFIGERVMVFNATFSNISFIS